ncbi:MAG: YbfB/YjiJ family MFS transporter, partial [Candidatus Rokuibacteriota bacterium]
ALAWGGWPPESAGTGAATAARRPAPRGPALRALYVEYALNAVGLVPHMVFLVDFVARGLGHGLHAGARYWVLFGLGAVVGPMLAGAGADRIGFGLALRLALVVQAAAVALPAVTADPLWLVVSSLVIGAAVPGIVPLVLGRVHELLPHDPEGQRGAWSVTTMAFALGQAAGAYGFSFLFAGGGSYPTLFALAAGAMALALVINLGGRLAAPRPI